MKRVIYFDDFSSSCRDFDNMKMKDSIYRDKNLFKINLKIYMYNFQYLILYSKLQVLLS